MAFSLWGEAFETPMTPEKTKKILGKADGRTEAQILKSKKTPIEDKIEIITRNVLKTLGHYKDIITVIKTRGELHQYIDASISNGIIAIDTETNNSLDALTCKLMGVCIYTPGQKSAYIPIHHIDRITESRLSWQLTEQDIREELERLKSTNTKILMHNGKFDYKVFLCTCNLDLDIYWDSYVAARLIDENEPSAGLKQQYISKIDPTQEKYSIDHLFNELPYAIFDPELFAYYAAIDAYMTYKLYEWQLERFKDPDLTGSFNIFNTIEMPLIKIVANMELAGVELDQTYAKRLSAKYHKLLDACTLEVENELKKFEEKILEWRLTPDANFKSPNKKGDGLNKSKSEQLETPMNTESPTQLAILLYDVLGAPQVSTKAPRGTGVDELEALVKKTDLNICKLILKKRKLDKLTNTFIDKLPNDVSSVDGRVHCEFLSLGTDCITGDSSILTPRGVEFMEDIVGECFDGDYREFNYPLINELNRIETTSHKIMFKNAPTYKIKTYYGFELEGTPNHPIRTLNKSRYNLTNLKKLEGEKYHLDQLWDNYGWSQLQNLKIGDYVLIDAKPHPYTHPYLETNLDQNVRMYKGKSSKMPEYFDEDFAELLGMFHADGMLYDAAGSCAFVLTNEQPEVVERFKYLCLKCFDQEALPIPKYGENIITGYEVRGPKYRQLSNIIHTGKTKKRIPKQILQSNDKVFNAYIKGLTLDSSNRSPENDCLEIIIFNKQDAQACQSRFLAQGVLSYLVKTEIKDHKYEYGIGFRYKSLKWFYENVGVIQSKKVVPIKEPNYTYYYEKDGLIALPIKEITTQVNTVYDFTLPETHSFISNGFISHNTGRFSSKNPNLQQIPRANIEIKPLFKAPSAKLYELEFESCLDLNPYHELQSADNSWVKVKDLYIGSIVRGDSKLFKVTDLHPQNQLISIKLEEVF